MDRSYYSPKEDIKSPPPGQDVGEELNKIKPIFTVGLPTHVGHEVVDQAGKRLGDSLTDYYVIVYSGSSQEVIFQAFYPKELDERSFDELKEYVLNELKK